MPSYNNQKNDESKEKLIQVQEKIETIKSVMHDNITVAIGNTENLDKIAEQAENLKYSSHNFNDQAKKLKNNLWWKQIKLYIMIAVVFIIILSILVTVIVLYSQNNSNNSNRKLFSDLSSYISISKNFIPLNNLRGSISNHRW